MWGRFSTFAAETAAVAAAAGTGPAGRVRRGFTGRLTQNRVDMVETMMSGRGRMFRSLCLAGLLVGLCAARAQGGGGLPKAMAPYFAKVTAGGAHPDADGFIRRWLLLEPISVPVKSNTVFTDSYLKGVFGAQYFKGQGAAVPKDGSAARVGQGRLKWHALDSRLYNVKLFRFATSLGKPRYGVLFWAVTLVDCPEEMRGVRLSVGSNGASAWWLNGEEAVTLEGDRRMVRDDVVSRRLTLKKGRNVLWGAVVNGPGMSDFCIRFVDAQGKAVRNITVNVK